MIVINRNPIDTIPSYALLKTTGSHSLTIEQEWHKDFPDFWNTWVTENIQNIKKDHDIVFNDMARQIPTYFCRYEDLKINPQPLLEELFTFLLDVPSIEGTVVQRRIAEVCQTGFETKAVYKLKDTSNNLSRARHMYN